MTPSDKQPLLALPDLTPLAPIRAKITPYQGNKPHKRRCEIAISCIFKNEAVWLREWLEFHKLIGVEHFFLYNNFSDDHYMEILQPYIADGCVELFDYPVLNMQNFDQLHANNHALELSRDCVEWLAMIDSDEFINPITHDNLKLFLRDHKQMTAFSMKWLLYGTSHVNELGPKDLMIEKLIYRGFLKDAYNKWTKPLVRPKYTRASIFVHMCSYLHGAFVGNPGYDELRINHYFVRTENYMNFVKMDRLKDWNARSIIPERLIHFAPRLNSVRDYTMIRFVAPLKKTMFG